MGGDIVSVNACLGAAPRGGRKEWHTRRGVLRLRYGRGWILSILKRGGPGLYIMYNVYGWIEMQRVGAKKG